MTEQPLTTADNTAAKKPDFLEKPGFSSATPASSAFTVLGRVIVRQSKAILFVTICLCLAGVLAGWSMPSSIFPQTNFPRVAVMIDNGVMPADQMMATITRPIEEAMKDIPGVTSVRSATSRGSAEVNVFFNWSVDMQTSELHVHSRLSQIRASLPTTATTTVWRMTFSAFPIIGVSLTSSSGRSQTELWDIARYTIKPRLLTVPGIARIDLVGGRTPEYHVKVDPLRLEGYKLSLNQVSDALAKNNLIGTGGLHDEEHQLYLTVADARVKDPEKEIPEIVVAQAESGPVRIKDFAEVGPGQEPQFTIVTADGKRAVLLNVRSQIDGSTLAIADGIKEKMSELEQELNPLKPDLQLAFFYDQSVLVREAVGGVWESIFFGLLLSAIVLFLFLKSGQSWRTTTSTTLVAVVVIPVTVLVTLVAMRLLGMSYNLMTLGGIAAAIGLVIDDAIVVIEAIATHIGAGDAPPRAVELATREIFRPLVSSTLTPVVVFLPLTFLEGIQGVFFRALAVTMVVALLTSLVLAVALTPSLAARLIHVAPGRGSREAAGQGGPVLRWLIGLYERAARLALRHAGLTCALTVGVLAGAVGLYFVLPADFLPEMDEGAFVIDYEMPPGTALSETDRTLKNVEKIITDPKQFPEIESYSRRTGIALHIGVEEPHKGDYHIKLKKDRRRSTEEVKKDLKKAIKDAERVLTRTNGIDMPGMLGDLIEDLSWEPGKVEVKIFSTDVPTLKKQAQAIADLIYREEEGQDGKREITAIDGVESVQNGLVYTGSSQIYRVRGQDLLRYGIKADDVARTMNIALLGETPSVVLKGDRQINIRLRVDPKYVPNARAIESLLVRSETGGAGTRLSAVTDRSVEAAQLELRREDLRQYVAVRARVESDLSGTVDRIKAAVDKNVRDRPNFTLEYGGLYRQQQESFNTLRYVLVAAVLLVFLVLLIEFRSLMIPLAIVWGSLLSLLGVGLALWATGTSLNIISYLGAIIGQGIVAKNGILMMDYVEHLRAQGLPLTEALVQSGRRRLRPVLMTSLATMLGMLPLAWGLGTGAQMLQPLAIAVMGALAISLLLSLVATPATYLLGLRVFGRE